MRGQFLPMIDVRSLRVLGFGLRPEKSYNAAMIRTLITWVCDEHGLPRKGFYFERGIFGPARVCSKAMPVPIHYLGVKPSLGCALLACGFTTRASHGPSRLSA